MALSIFLNLHHYTDITKQEIACLEKRGADTQKRENEKLRVREKKSGHAKCGKQEVACRGKKVQTRKKEKMRNCVSGKKRCGHVKRRK